MKEQTRPGSGKIWNPQLTVAESPKFKSNSNPKLAKIKPDFECRSFATIVNNL